LVIEGSVVITIPFIALFLLDVISISVMVFDSASCIPASDNVTQVAVILISPSVTFLRWSETVGRVPTWILSVVKLLTLDTIVVIENSVRYCGCVKDCLKPLNMRFDFFIVFR
jgi:hypothetical protein